MRRTAKTGEKRRHFTSSGVSDRRGTAVTITGDEVAKKQCVSKGLVW